MATIYSDEYVLTSSSNSDYKTKSKIRIDYTISQTATNYTITGEICIGLNTNKGGTAKAKITRATSAFSNFEPTPTSTSEVSTSRTFNQWIYETIYTFSKTFTRDITSSSRKLSWIIPITISNTLYSNTKTSYSSGDFSVTIPALQSYSITYNANGGSGTPGTQTKYYGRSINLQSSGSTRSGYVLERWNTESDGTGTYYSLGVGYTDNASLSLYAVWHHNPTCTYTYTPLTNYYANETSTKIQVQITEKTHYDPVTASACHIYLLNSEGTTVITSSSRSTTGTLTLTPPSTAGTYSLKLKVWDSTGYIKQGSTIYSLGTVTVKENTPPICTATTTSSGNYYGGVSTYSVNITNATAYNGKTIKSIKLTVGSVTATRTDNGVLSVTVPNIVNQTDYTPTVIITDNMDESSPAYSLSQITVYPNAEPTATYTITPVTYYYGGASTYSINVTATTYYQKTLSKIELQVGSQTTSRTSNGSLSIALNSVNSTTTSTVKLIITDNINKSKTYNLDSITVYPNSKPSCTAQQTSSGYYYANYTAKPFIVTISNATAATSEHKTIKEIKLQLGNQSVTRTTNGTLSIVPNTVDTFIPKVTITDNMNVSQSYNLNSVTINENKAPTATITVSNAPAIYENTPVNTTAYTPYIITLSNVTAYNNKTIKNVTLTIGNETVSTTTVTNGTTLKIEPKVAGTFTPVVVVTDKIDDNNNLVGATKTYNQTAITVKTRTIGISNVTIQRIIAEPGTAGTLNDEGTNAVIKATFSYSQYEGANGKNYLIQPSVKNGNTELTTTWYTGWSSLGGFTGPVNWTGYYPSLGASGITLYGKVAPNSPLFDINTSYNITITPISTAKTGNAISVNLAQAFYLLAGRAGGHALGIGKKPSTNGILDVGMGKIVLNDYDGNPPALSYRIGTTIRDMIALTQDSKMRIYGQFFRDGISSGWNKGRDNALLRTSAINAYSPVISVKSTNGSWDIGSYNHSSYTDDLIFTYVTDTLYAGTATNFTSQIRFLEDGGIKANSLTSNLITVDQATLGDLVVNGNVSFINARTVVNNLVDNLELYTSVPIDGDTYIASYADGKNVTHNGVNTYGRRPITKLWDYIATKLNDGSFTDKSYIVKSTTVDLGEADNGITAVVNRDYGARDKNGSLYSVFEHTANTNGSVSAYMGVRNKQSDGTFTGWTGISINKTKTNSTTISLGAATTVNSTLRVNNLLTLYRESTTAQNYGAGISFSVKDTTTGITDNNAYIYVYEDHASSAYGTNMVIQTGGGIFIGGGESPGAHYSAKGASYTGEDTFITTDGDIYIQAKGNTIADRLGMRLNTSHQLVPIKADVYTNNVGSIGTSDYKWADLYVTNINGTAVPAITAGTVGTSSATSGNTLAIPYVTYNAKGMITAVGTHTHTITNNITGSGTSGKLAKFNGTNTLTNGPTVTISTAAPSGGANGDIWFRYTTS